MTLSSGGVEERGGSTGSKSHDFFPGNGGMSDGRSSVDGASGSALGIGRAFDSSARSAKEASGSGDDKLGVMGSSTRLGSGAAKLGGVGAPKVGAAPGSGGATGVT